MNKSLSTFIPSRTDAEAGQLLKKSLGVSSSEALAKGMVSETGLTFEKTGKEIQEGIKKKIAELTDKIKQLSGIPKGVEQKLGDATIILPEGSGEASSALQSPYNWEIESLKTQIKNLDTVARNIDPKKKFKLCQWDLTQFGL